MRRGNGAHIRQVKLRDDKHVAVRRMINVPVIILPIIPQAQEMSLNQVQDSLNPQPEGEVLFTASLQEQLLFANKK